MSKLYLRDTDTYTGYAATELSTAMTPTSGATTYNNRSDLSETKGALQTSITFNTLANQNPQTHYLGKWISPPLVVSAIDAATWTFAYGASEGNNAANSSLALSIYVLKNDGTVRGYIYDAADALGTEWGISEIGRLWTSGTLQSVTGIVSTDRLVVEVWRVGTQAMSVAYSQNFFLNGTVDPTEGVGGNDYASYLSTAQDLFTIPPINADPALASGISSNPTISSSTGSASEIAVTSVAQNATISTSKNVDAGLADSIVAAQDATVTTGGGGNPDAEVVLISGVVEISSRQVRVGAKAA